MDDSNPHAVAPRARMTDDQTRESERVIVETLASLDQFRFSSAPTVQHYKAYPDAGREVVAMIYKANASLIECGHAEPTSYIPHRIEILVARIAGLPVGFVLFYTEEDSAWIQLSWVEPEHRKRGVWKMMWVELVKQCRERKIPAILSGVNVKNEAMLKAAASVGRRQRSITLVYDVK